VVAEYLELDELRSVDDLNNYRSSLTADVESWEKEYKGLPFPDEIKPTYMRHNEVIDLIDRRVLELNKRHQRLAKIADRPENQERGDDAFSAPTVMKKRDRSDVYEINRALQPDEWNERARYIIDDFRPPLDLDRAEAQENLTDMLDDGGVVGQHITLHSSPTYRSAWLKVLRAGMGGYPNLNPPEQRALAEAQRAMSLAGAGGGFAVPVDLDPTLLNTSNGVVNPIRSIARVVRTTVDTWRGVTSGAITASYATEATETTDNSPTLAQPEISTEKAQAFVPMSIEITMDWPTIRDELATLLADAKDTLEASKFATGTGTNEPQGVVTGATNTVNATTGQAFDLEDVYRLRQALPPRYRPRATFLGDIAILDRVRQFETAAGGTGSGVVWVDSLQDDLPSRLFGKAVYEFSEMVDVTTTGSKFLLYGDFSRYVIVDRVGLTIDFIPHLFGANQRPTGQRGIYAFWRNSAEVIDANAFRVLIGIA
jgi:HK97 family phage major capsid protein